MTLYAADVMDLAKPVEKKKRGKKQEQTPPPSETSSPTKEEKVEPVKKEKKPLTEKQKLAIQKAQETRKRKREEMERQVQEQQEAVLKKQQEIEQKEQELNEKKEKRKQKRLEKKQESLTLAQEVDDEINALQKKKPAKKERDHPPTWFTKYIEGVKKEQSKNGEKKPVKKIQEEAVQVAQQKWDDGLVRDRLRNEVDSHMNRMYSMIFGNRVLR